MITPQLEKWLLTGKASYAVHTHSLGMFGRIPCEKGKLAIITKIVWNPFLSFHGILIGDNTLNSLFRFNSCTLRVDGTKTKSDFIFRNQLKFDNPNTGVAGSVNLDTVLTVPFLNTFLSSNIIQPGPPVIVDTFLVCSDLIKLTIFKNIETAQYITNSGLISQEAGEVAAPNGVADCIVAREVQMVGPGVPQSQYYYPPSEELDGITSNVSTRRKWPLLHDIARRDATYYQSELPPPENFTAQFNNIMNPLVSFHVVYVNAAIADQLQSTT